MLNGLRTYDPAIREMLDDATELDADVEKTCDELASINRHFGGYRVLRYFLGRWLRPGRTFRVLDLCSGAGDGARYMVQWARRRQIPLEVDAVDANPAAISLGVSRSAAYPEIHYHCGDALGGMPRDRYDLVNCSLALHHFSELHAAALLCRMAELSQGWVLATDLERSRLTTAAIWLLTATLYRHRMTAHDGRMSAARAFSYPELDDLVGHAGWARLGRTGHVRFFPCRQSLWLDRHATSAGRP